MHKTELLILSMDYPETGRGLQNVFMVRLLSEKKKPLTPSNSFSLGNVHILGQKTNKRIKGSWRQWGKMLPKEYESFQNPAAKEKIISLKSVERKHVCVLKESSMLFLEQSECSKYSENSCCWGENEITKVMPFPVSFYFRTLPTIEKA